MDNSVEEVLPWSGCMSKMRTVIWFGMLIYPISTHIWARGSVLHISRRERASLRCTKPHHLTCRQESEREGEGRAKGKEHPVLDQTSFQNMSKRDLGSMRTLVRCQDRYEDWTSQGEVRIADVWVSQKKKTEADRHNWRDKKRCLKTNRQSSGLEAIFLNLLTGR